MSALCCITVDFRGIRADLRLLGLSLVEGRNDRVESQDSKRQEERESYVTTRTKASCEVGAAMMFAKLTLHTPRIFSGFRR